MSLTRNGIAYNFHYSPYEVKVPYKNNDLIFRFSSANNVKKFKDKKDNNRDVINYSLSKRFKTNIMLDFIADLKLYTLIETRGFLIISKDNEFECLEEVIFDGQNLTKKNLQD